MKKMFTFVAAMLLCTVAFAEEKELFNPANASIKETYFAPNWTLDDKSTATYDATTGTISIDIQSDLVAQWQGQVKLQHDVTFDPAKSYILSMKFHSNKAFGGVTVKMDDNANVVYANQEIKLPADADYVFTSAKSNGVAGNNKIMVFDFGHAAAGTKITISNISIKEVGEAVAVEPVEHPAPAVAPTRAAANVFSIYSDVYTAGTKMAIGGWEQKTKIEEVNLSETDKAFYCTGSDYMGWELNANVAIAQLANYPYLHMDIYVAEAASIMFQPIWGAGGMATFTLAAGWNSLDIDLVEKYNGIDLAKIYQLKWDGMPSTCYFDNVYFYNNTETALPMVENVQTAVKTIENGQLVILRDGIRYNAQGKVIE